MQLIKKSEPMQVEIAGASFTLTPTALIIPDGTSEEQSIAIIKHLKRFQDVLQFGIGDWMAYHRKNFGDESTAAAVEQMEMDLGECQKALNISCVDQRARDSRLSPAHHYVIGLYAQKNSLTLKQQKDWIITAINEDLSPMELRHSIEAGKVIHEVKDKTSGVVAIEGIRSQFTRWLRQATTSRPIDTWTAEEKHRLLEEITPILELGELLKG